MRRAPPHRRRSSSSDIIRPISQNSLQATFDDHPGLLVVIGTYGDSLVERHGDTWYVKLWDWNTPHQEYPDSFDSRDAARSWAEREFLIAPAAWEECDGIGSAETIADVLKRIYRRPLTCDEAAAAAHLMYAYEFIDRRGRPIWPGEERCITSFNVIADVMDTLDWERGTCRLFPTDARSSYGFVADAAYSAEAVKSSPQFRAMWDAFIAAAGVTRWDVTQARPARRAVRIPDGAALSSSARALFDGEGSGGYETGAMGNALGITHRGHVLFIDAGSSITLNEQWTDVRTMHVVAHDDVVHVIFRRYRPDGSCRFYLTSLDATLRKALLRLEEKQPLVELHVDDERERFAEEAEAWLAASTSAGPAAFELPAAGPEDDIDGLIARAGKDLDALDEAVAFLKSHSVFVAEAMNHAPPHVVRRVVLSALEAMKAKRARG